jgi:hypothetical protein
LKWVTPPDLFTARYAALGSTLITKMVEKRKTLTITGGRSILEGDYSSYDNVNYSKSRGNSYNIKFDIKYESNRPVIANQSEEDKDLFWEIVEVMMQYEPLKVGLVSDRNEFMEALAENLELWRDEPMLRLFSKEEILSIAKARK